MKFLQHHAFYFLITLTLFGSACSDNKVNDPVTSYNYIPDDKKLHDTIVQLDSIFFDAYNTCATNLEKHAAFYSDSLEFYHDKGGLSTSKKETVDAIRRNVCGKV